MFTLNQELYFKSGNLRNAKHEQPEFTTRKRGL